MQRTRKSQPHHLDQHCDPGRAAATPNCRLSTFFLFLRLSYTCIHDVQDAHAPCLFHPQSWRNTLTGITLRHFFLFRIRIFPCFSPPPDLFNSQYHQRSPHLHFLIIKQTLDTTAYNTPAPHPAYIVIRSLILLHSFNLFIRLEHPTSPTRPSGAFIRSSHVTTNHSTLFFLFPSLGTLSHSFRTAHSFRSSLINSLL